MAPIAVPENQTPVQTASADLKGKAKYSSQDIMDMEHEYSA